MKVWIDADACPREVREIVFRSSTKHRFPVRLVANKLIHTPTLRWIQAIQVAAGMDEADAYIAEHAQPGDLVITQDVPLAAEIVEKGVDCMSPRGEAYDPSSIGERLAMRDFFTEVRASGIHTGGPAPFDAKAKQSFANAFDRWRTASMKGS